MKPCIYGQPKCSLFFMLNPGHFFDSYINCLFRNIAHGPQLALFCTSTSVNYNCRIAMLQEGI